MKRQIQPFIENISEATAACLITMVQGNLLAITLGHWLIAAETGLIAGSIASAALVVWKTSKAWVVSLVLGVVTTIVDSRPSSVPGWFSLKSAFLLPRAGCGAEPR